jgi:hypothetical protein
MAIGIKDDRLVLLPRVVTIKNATHQCLALVAIHHGGEFATGTNLGNEAACQGRHGAAHAGMEPWILTQDGSQQR